MTVQEYIDGVSGTIDQVNSLSDKIDTMSYDHRIWLRSTLVKQGFGYRLMPNLTYDYDLQQWIGLDQNGELIWDKYELQKIVFWS